MSTTTAASAKDSFVEDLWNGIKALGTILTRQPFATIVSLLCSWTALFAALWLAVVLAIVGVVLGFVAGDIAGSIEGHHSFALLGAIGGFFVGFLVGFALIFGASLAAGIVHIVITVFIGVLLAALITGACLLFEGTSMDWRGYRRTSRRAQEGQLPELMRRVAIEMGIRGLPELRVKDDPVPGAWAHMWHIVVTKGLIDQLSEEELAAILAHELHHWVRRDTVALRFVWACSIPLVILANLYYLVSEHRRGGGAGMKGASLVALAVLWPAVVLLRLAIMPTMMSRCRQLEYEADAAAIAAGFGSNLGEALSKIADFEVPRTGWEAALLRTHPPIEFRLEAIEEAAAKPAPRATAASGAGKATNGRSRQSARSTGSAAG